jgi:hypothetical protein
MSEKELSIKMKFFCKPQIKLKYKIDEEFINELKRCRSVAEMMEKRKNEL